jgi:hypothetical protein
MLNSVRTSLFVAALMAAAPAWSIMPPQEVDALCKEKTLKIMEDLHAMANPRVKLQVRDAKYFSSERSTSALYTVGGIDGYIFPIYEVRVRAYDDKEITPQPFCQIRTIKDMVD